jgi:hypothetical protein
MEWSAKKILKKILSSTISPPKKKNSKFGKEYYAEWYKNNKVSCRESQLKYKFGITLAEYNDMAESQGGVCAICGGVNDTRRKGTNNNGKDVKMSLAVDHNHKTGKVRGLLCGKCNISLGNFKDNPALLRKAIRYLENTEGFNV